MPSDYVRYFDAPKVYVKMLNAGVEHMTTADVIRVRSHNENVARGILSAPPSSGGGGGMAPKPKGWVSVPPSGARNFVPRSFNGSTPISPGALNALAAAYMASVWLATANTWSNLHKALLDALNHPVGGLVPIGTPGVPADTLPQGVEYSQGPCRNWGNDPTPVPMTNGAITPCFAAAYANGSRNILDDAQMSAALSSSTQSIYLNADKGPSGENNTLWRNYAWVRNPLAPSDVVWNSAVHGRPHAVPGTAGLAASLLEEQFKKLLAKTGYNTGLCPDFEKLLQHVPGSASGAPNQWWLKSPLRVPVIGQGVIVMPDPNNGVNNGVDTSVPPPGRPPGPPPGVTFPPDMTNFDPFRRARRINGNLYRVSRSAGRPGRGQKERKGRIAKAISNTLDVMGTLSEVGDDIDAIYKALPASVRRNLIDENNGRYLSAPQKFDAIVRYYDRIDVGVAVAGLITTRVDDYVAAQVSQPLDRALQVAVPDYVTRLGVRQAIGWAYKTTGQDSPIPRAPSSQRLLPKSLQQQKLSEGRNPYL